VNAAAVNRRQHQPQHPPAETPAAPSTTPARRRRRAHRRTPNPLPRPPIPSSRRRKIRSRNHNQARRWEELRRQPTTPNQHLQASATAVTEDTAILRNTRPRPKTLLDVTHDAGLSRRKLLGGEDQLRAHCPTLCLRGPPAAHRPRLNHFPIPVRVKASSSQIAHDEPVAYGLWCANGLSVVLRSGGRGTGARLGLIRAFASPFAGRRWLFQLQGAIDCSDVRRKIAG